MIATIKWDGKHILMVDQRKIPSRIEWYTCRGYKDVIRAIEKMVIRGAPAIGVAAAMGLALAAASIRTRSYDNYLVRFKEIAGEMVSARPTAVNLKWAADRMVRLVEACAGYPVEEITKLLKKESQRILDEDIAINRRIGLNGQELVDRGSTILTHCNAGSLATGGYGTALGVIRAAHENGKSVEVLADETRPWLQGLRLTAFELIEEGIPVSVIADSAAGFFLNRKKVDLVITGADRIAANGDVANKIGTYQLAVLAKTNEVPFYVAAPISTIDLSLGNGDMIPVEERGSEEICRFGNLQMGPSGVCALNPAFDITPSKYISAIITELGIVRPPYRKNIKKTLRNG
jgi:methylthioribose-1-phosphate isomerase